MHDITKEKVLEGVLEENKKGGIDEEGRHDVVYIHHDGRKRMGEVGQEYYVYRYREVVVMMCLEL
jgi:hypothetical protein